MEKIWKELKDESFLIVAVEAFNDRERAKKIIKDKGLSFLFLDDEKNNGEKVYQKYGVSAFPTAFLFGKNGKLLSYYVGYEQGIENKIKEEIIKEMK